ncbi:MAG: YkgJ family cysteine cluster protein [Bdellovibrio sp.]|nr:YkgJ family cysteine cluster protein [Bdellovibrio sp.]
MKVPAIAAQTYDRCKNDPILNQIWQKMIKALSKLKMTDPIKRARFTHEAVDKSLEETFSNPVVSKYVSCKKGCSGCCYTQVSITHDEATLLAQIAQKKLKNKIDFVRLEKQARTGDNAVDWYKLSYNDRRCMFLDENNECMAYEDRPSVCRTNNVFSPAILCDTRDGIEHPIRLLKTEAADMAIAASFMTAKDSGALPYMLWKTLLEWQKISREVINWPTTVVFLAILVAFANSLKINNWIFFI